MVHQGYYKYHQDNQENKVGEIIPVGYNRLDGDFRLIKCKCKKYILKKITANRTYYYNSRMLNGHYIFNDPNNRPAYIMITKKVMGNIYALNGNSINHKTFNVTKSECNKPNHYQLSTYENGKVSKSHGELNQKKDKIVFHNKQGDKKYIMYVNDEFKFDAPINTPEIRTKKIVLNNDPKKAQNKHISWYKREQLCSPNEFMCGLSSKYNGYSVGGMTIKCCKFES